MTEIVLLDHDGSTFMFIPIAIFYLLPLFVDFQSSEVKYLTLHSIDDLLELFTKQEEDEGGEEEDHVEEEEGSHLG